MRGLGAAFGMEFYAALGGEQMRCFQRGNLRPRGASCCFAALSAWECTRRGRSHATKRHIAPCGCIVKG